MGAFYLVSLRKYISRPQPAPRPAPDQERPFLRVISLLLEALSIHAVDYRPDQKAQFQNAVRELAGKLEDAKSEAQALVYAGEVIDVLRRYNRDVETVVAAKARELQSMVAMLTDTVVQLCGTTAVSVHNLVELERDLKNADEIEDIHQLKVRLSTHLSTMRREMEGQQRRFEQLKTIAQAQSQPAQQAGVTESDPATGLPGPEAAEAAIEAALQRGTRSGVGGVRD